MQFGSTLLPSLAVCLALLSGPVSVRALTPDQQNAVNAHNTARKAPELKKPRDPLKWSDDLARDAAAYAQLLAADPSGELKHSQDRNNQGENLWWGSGNSQTPFQDATNAFLDEKSKYNCAPIQMKTPEQQKAFGTFGHYTQCVWPATKEFGMASAVSKFGKGTFVVARYRPAGNMVGESACY